MEHRFDHPAWTTAIGTLLAYLLVLVVAFVVLFLLPYAAFVAFGG